MLVPAVVKTVCDKQIKGHSMVVLLMLCVQMHMKKTSSKTHGKLDSPLGNGRC